MYPDRLFEGLLPCHKRNSIPDGLCPPSTESRASRQPSRKNMNVRSVSFSDLSSSLLLLFCVLFPAEYSQGLRI